MVGSCLSCWRQRCWAYLRGAEDLLLIAVVAKTPLPPAELSGVTWMMNSEGFPVLLCGDGMCAEVLSAEMLGEMWSCVEHLAFGAALNQQSWAAALVKSLLNPKFTLN